MPSDEVALRCRQYRRGTYLFLRSVSGRPHPRRTGVPIARGALAAFECRLETIVEHTTHFVLIGEVVETVLGDGRSLVYLDGGFSRVPRTLSAA